MGACESWENRIKIQDKAMGVRLIHWHFIAHAEYLRTVSSHPCMKLVTGWLLASSFFSTFAHVPPTYLDWCLMSDSFVNNGVKDKNSIPLPLDRVGLSFSLSLVPSVPSLESIWTGPATNRVRYGTYNHGLDWTSLTWLRTSWDQVEILQGKMAFLGDGKFWGDLWWIIANGGDLASL